MTDCPHCRDQHAHGTDFCPRTGRPIIEAAIRMVGRTIDGKYKLLRCIGQGGMGTIFEAEHNVIGNRVALKILHESFADSRESVQRLYREARATGAIGHKNIIHIFDVGETSEGTPFLVMELLNGESLGERMEQEGMLPLGRALDIAIQILSALSVAHSAGIIHRDLKSDNVFLVDNGKTGQDEIKLLDFGVSKFTNPGYEDLKLTQTGSVLGTPYYMSPEQACGSKDLDGRVDVYATGVILYEMLTGSLPHEATNYNALLMKIMTSDVESLGNLRNDLPEALESVILKALHRERDGRWASASDFMEQLIQIRKGLSDSEMLRLPEIPLTSIRNSRSAMTVDISEAALESGILELPNQRKRVWVWVAGVAGIVLGMVFYLSHLAGLDEENEMAKNDLGPSLSREIQSGDLEPPLSPLSNDENAEPEETAIEGSDSVGQDGRRRTKQTLSSSKDGISDSKSVDKKRRHLSSKKSRRKGGRKPKNASSGAAELSHKTSSKPTSIDQPMDNPF